MINFVKVRLKWLGMPYDAIEWQTNMPNMTTSGPV